MKLAAVVLVAACSSAPTHVAPAPVQAPAPWPVPDGWRSELIPFPLDFAPTLTHRGVEEIRFAPKFFDPTAPGYWSYAFVWRLDDAPTFDASIVGGELTTYFRGLVTAVDEKHELTTIDTIAAHAESKGDDLALTVHVIDAFATKQPVDLVGAAMHRACGAGSLWIFVLAPQHSGVRSDLDALAAQAACNQPPVPNKKR
jgi:hypothetical protein